MDRQLKNYLPRYLRDIKEYSLIVDSEQPEVGRLWAGLTETMSDQFVSNLTLYGIKRWEKQLGIIPKATDTLDDRRFRIYLRLIEQPPYTYEYLINKLQSICGDDGYTIILDKKYYLKIKIMLSRKNQFDEVKKLLNRIIPANILLDLDYMYNKYYQLLNRRHKDLNSFTHNTIRSEVLQNGN